MDDRVQKTLDDMLEPYRDAVAQHWVASTTICPVRRGLFGTVEHRVWRSEQPVTLDGLLEMAASRSYVASLDEEPRGELLERIRAEFADEPDPIVRCATRWTSSSPTAFRDSGPLQRSRAHAGPPHTVWSGGARPGIRDGRRPHGLDFRRVPDGAHPRRGRRGDERVGQRIAHRVRRPGNPDDRACGERAVWDELTFGNFTYAYVLTRAAGEKAPVKQIDYLVHQNDGDGEWLTSMAGEGATLAYADLVVLGKTLSDDTDVYFADRGTLRRVVGRTKRVSRRKGRR